jgi:hypothetical protein
MKRCWLYSIGKQMKQKLLSHNQITALKNGATMFIFPFDSFLGLTSIKFQTKEDELLVAKQLGFDLEIGDKQIQVNQSDLYIKEVLDIRIVRLQDISHNKGEIYNIYPEAHVDGYDNFMRGFNIKYCDNRYEENDYVILIEVMI